MLAVDPTYKQLPRPEKAPSVVDGRRVSVTPVSWMAPDDLKPSEWVEHGRRLGIVGRNVAWWIGDWLRYGNARYGERYSRATRITGYDRQTLMNYVYVTTRFEPSRRWESLSWSHHAELAALPEADQDELLSRAEAERMSVRDVRELLRAKRRYARSPLAPAAPGAASEQTRATPAAEVLCPKCGLAVALPPARGASPRRPACPPDALIRDGRDGPPPDLRGA